MNEISVNKPEIGISYKQREGAYAIISNETQEIAVIQTSTGFFLPGGGIEEGEDMVQCLKRECIEEAGMEVEIQEKLSVVSYFLYSTTLSYYMESKGHFYRCKSKGFLDVETEEDHQLVWLSKKEASEKMFLANQRYAVKNA